MAKATAELAQAVEQARAQLTDAELAGLLLDHLQQAQRRQLLQERHPAAARGQCRSLVEEDCHPKGACEVGTPEDIAERLWRMLFRRDDRRGLVLDELTLEDLRRAVSGEDPFRGV